MTKAFTVSMAKIIEENGLETVYMPCDPANLMVSSADVNRPGLALGGYFDYGQKRARLSGGFDFGDAHQTH